MTITSARAQDRDGGAIELDPVIVNAEKANGPVNGYVAQRSATGTKTNAAIVQTPQSISVVTRQQIEAQGARTVSESLRYEPGVVAETRPGSRFDTTFIRGFGGFGGNANYIQYWDNLRLPKGVSYNVPSIDPYLLERIEILRGPASVLYGQGNPGGLINLVSKMPNASAKNEIQLRTGSHNLAELDFDLNGAVNADGTLLYRVIGVGRKADGGVDYTKDERFLLAPMITWTPDPDTSVTLQATYQRDPDSYQSNWLPALGTLQRNPNGQIPRDFFSGNPAYNSFDRTQATIGYQAQHRFNDTWSVRQNFRYMHAESEFKALSVPGGGSAWASAALCGGVSYLCLARSATHYVENLDAVAVDNQLEANFATGPLEHKLLAGLDFQYLNANATYGNGATTYVNYLNPIYGSITAPTLTTYQKQTRTQIGTYLQDQITFGGWHAILGVRHDWANTSVDTQNLATGALTRGRTRDTAFTWKAGLLYEFDNGLAPYASYSTSFDPTTGTGYGGVAFKPTTGQQYEAGIKYQPPGFKGLITASVFDLTQQNVLTTDTLHTSTNTAVTLCSSTTCQIQTGEVRSRGVEIGGKLTPVDGLNLIASYTYNDVEVTKSNVANVQGKVPVGVPRQTAALWADYTFQSGTLANLTVGAGLRYVGSSFGDQTNTHAMRVPSYTLVDASISYDFKDLRPALKGWRASLTGSNLLNKTYVAACASANQCFYGTGRTITGSLSYRW
ncbi:TonB-dependent siderophore receptor [Labrys sp. WJW]|uniref:TonB-dependent siderophore receptor n=1 Tax=Labrys sp. WJW TaxID=1737983 RepID=UPI00138FD8D7|nr:TonB-dependent siderophore receptor [Labrys sp. WJW]